MGYYDFLIYVIKHYGLLLFFLFIGFLILVAVVTWNLDLLGLPPKKKKRKRSNDCQYF